jgi:hypothetical protein
LSVCHPIGGGKIKLSDIGLSPTQPERTGFQPYDEGVRGSLFVFQLFDVSEAIDMEQLSRKVGGPDARRDVAARQSAQTRVWFEPPPHIRALGEIEFLRGELFHAEVHYYSYGVVSVRLERSFDLDWPGLIELCSRWVGAAEAEAAAATLVRRELEGLQSALVKPHDILSEDYAVVRLDPIPAGDTVLTADQVLERYCSNIAQIVRGETTMLAAEEQTHVLAARLSYYPTDVIVAGWTGAVIYDTPQGAEATVQLIEYANTQLLEFRFYDEMLTRTLAEVYQRIDEGTGLFKRYRLAGEAERFNTVRLDVRELTERTDNAAKFLSDMFAARLYQLVATRVGVPDYRRLVDDKLRTAAELYHLMTERVHQTSALMLETMVVIILIIDLIFLFRGKA